MDTTIRTRRDTPLNIRATLRQRALIERAAKAVGKSRSEFMLDSSCREAEDVLLDRTYFTLTDEQFERLEAILDAPAPPTDELRALLKAPAPWDDR